MEDRQLTATSRFLSLVLRHKPGIINLSLDANGWAAVDELLEKLARNGRSTSLAELEFIVQSNAKKRFAFDASGKKIRASQGHSIDIDAGYPATEPPGILYHGTAMKFIDAIISSGGLQKMHRQHVHLSADQATALTVGCRHGEPLVITVDAMGMHQQALAFYQSENGVWLTDNVPLRFLQY